MIEVICLGKIKEKYLNDLITDYTKRINKYTKVVIKELKDNPDINVEEDEITKNIGGSNGVTDKIKNIVNYRLSFSKLTFPHGLFRGVLLEQIYRAYKINNNETYHK